MKRQLPKNVRQIGNVSDSSKIYVEDYVDTFFNQLCEKAEQETIGAFLVGETIQEENQDYIYVYGAIRMKELSIRGKELVIGDHVWKHACETCKEYFGDAEILGWFITSGEHSLEVNHSIHKIHQKFFSREKSVFVTKNARDKEEKFYIYKYKDMMECGGHYIYYEKNIEMQNYMIAIRKKVGFTPSEIIEDRVTKNFRSIIREKNEKTEQKNRSRLVYGISTFLILVIVVIGVNMLNDYEKMQNIQETIGTPSDDDETVEVLGQDITSQKHEEDEVTQGDSVHEDTPQVDTPQVETPQVETSQVETPKSEAAQVETPQPDSAENKDVLNPPKTYIVKKGDTLETISRKNYGDVLHVDEICKLNGLNDGNLIFIGQKLLLP